MYCKCSKSNNYKVIGECDPTKFDQKGAAAWNQIMVPEILQLPECYPDIEDLERVYVNVVIESTKVIATPTVTGENEEGIKATGSKLIVDGSICQTIVYTADTCEQALHSINFRYPFCTYIVLPTGVDVDDDKFCVEYCIENVYAKVLNPRTIFKTVTLFLLAENPTPICPAIGKTISGTITNSNTSSAATITVTLYDDDGNAIDYKKYTIAANGGTKTYSFTASCSKKYTVEFDAPGFTVTPKEYSYDASQLPITNANVTIS